MTGPTVRNSPARTRKLVFLMVLPISIILVLAAVIMTRNLKMKPNIQRSIHIVGFIFKRLVIRIGLKLMPQR